MYIIKNVDKAMTKMNFPSTTLKKTWKRSYTLGQPIVEPCPSIVPVSFAWASTPHFLQNM